MNNCQCSGIYRESRRVTMRLIVSQCIICGDPLRRDSVGDHIIPVSKGGRDGISNFIPLCRKQNASKGSRYLMKWELINNIIDKFPRMFFALMLGRSCGTEVAIIL